MADIVFRYPEMNAAADQIDALATKYITAATTLESDFVAAMSAGEGASKEKLVSFVKGSVSEYTGTTVPQLLNALANMLRGNAQQMENADQQVADSIPG